MNFLLLSLCIVIGAHADAAPKTAPPPASGATTPGTLPAASPTNNLSKNTVRLMGGTNFTQWNPNLEGMDVSPAKSPALSVGYMRKRPFSKLRYGAFLDYRSIFSREPVDGGNIVESNYVMLAPKIEFAFPVFRRPYVIVLGVATNYLLISKSNLKIAGRDHEIADEDHKVNSLRGLNLTAGFGGDLNPNFNWLVEVTYRLNQSIPILFSTSSNSSLMEILVGGEIVL